MKQKINIRILSVYVASVYCFIIAPGVLFFYDDPFSSPYRFTITDQYIIYFMIFLVGLGSLIILFLLNKYLKNTKICGLTVVLWLAGALAIIYVPSMILVKWETNINKNINIQLLESLQSHISGNLLETKLLESENNSLTATPNAIVFDLNNMRIDFKRSKWIFNKDIKYPNTIADLDYVIITEEKSPELLRDVTTLNWVAEAAKIDTRQTFKLFRVDLAIGILDWREKRLIAKELIKGDLPDRVFVSSLNTDKFYRPHEFRIRDCVYRELLGEIEPPAYNDFLLFVFFGLYGLPFVVIWALSKFLKLD